MGDSNEPTVDRRTFLRSTGAAGGAVALSGVGSGQELDNENEKLVGVSAAADMDEVVANLPAEAEVIHRNDDLRYLTVRMPSDASWLTQSSIEAEMGMTPGVRYTEDNGELYAFEVDAGAVEEVQEAVQADDPRLSEQYYPEQVNAPEAWETTRGSEDVTIAVVDTGADYEHPDLREQFRDNPGRDFVEGDDDPMPGAREDHGTHVAGLAAATTGNGTGVAGTSNSELINARVLGGRGGSAQSVADGIQWAADEGADIINLSLGASRPFDTVESAVSYAQDQGVLVVAAAGNSSTSDPHYPASYDGVVGVSAVDDSEDLARFSNYGDYIDVTGPGVEVLSTWPDGEYNRISGTSMSSPVVAGVAALGLAAYPDLSATELRNRLKQTASDIGLPESEQGAGQVDAAAIVEGGTGGGGGGGGDGEPPVPDMTVSATGPATGETVEFDGSLSFAVEGTIQSYEWALGDGTTKSGATVEHAYAEAGEYTVEMTVTASTGGSATESTTLTVSGDPVDDPGGPGSPGGSCGDTVETTTEAGSLNSAGDTASFVYEPRTAEPCDVTVSLSGGAGSDLDLYLTHDGSTASSSNYDQRSWTFGSDEEIEVDEEALAADAEFGITVSSYTGGGEYDLTIEESGTGSDDGSGGGGGGDDPDDPENPDNEAPIPRINPETRSAPVGDRIGFDAIIASDPDGRVASYEWDFGDGTTETGVIVEHAYAEAGEYTVELTVTDDDGASATESVTVTVGDGGGGGGGGGGGDQPGGPGGPGGPGTSCGAASATDSMSGRLETSFDDASFAYQAQLEDPCQVTISLSGPDNADFDAFVTEDGSEPDSFNYDRSATTPDSNEQLVIDSVSGDQEFGIMVQSWEGTGEFTLEIEELGK